VVWVGCGGEVLVGCGAAETVVGVFVFVETAGGLVSEGFGVIVCSSVGEASGAWVSVCSAVSVCKAGSVW